MEEIIQEELHKCIYTKRQTEVYSRRHIKRKSNREENLKRETGIRIQ